jgi:hypothetical protein
MPIVPVLRIAEFRKSLSRISEIDPKSDTVWVDTLGAVLFISVVGQGVTQGAKKLFTPQ